jgi:O-antigen/teichoic acid export membrane protein
MASMAGYSLAATYAFLPCLAVNSLLQRLFLPLLVGQEDPARFRRRYGVVRAVCSVAALSFFAIFLLIGPRGVEFLMSDKYEGIYPLTLIIALAAGVRTLRFSLVIPLLAKGETRIVLWGSLARCGGLIIAFAFAVWRHDLLWIAAAALIGELFAAIISVVVIRRSSSIPHCTILSVLLPFVASAALLATTHCFLDRDLPIPLVTGASFACLIFYFVKRSFTELQRPGQTP